MPIETLHPIRWTIALAVVLPALASVAFVLTKLGRGDAGRWLRLLRGILAAEFLVFVVLCFIGYVYEHRAQAHDAKLYPPPGRLVDIGGYRLHLNCSGEGAPTVVLEYGLEGSLLDWRRVQPEIARFARVCSYDRAGYGWSESNPRPRVPGVMAEELHALLQAVGEKPPYILVGHSYGSLIVQAFAHRFPDDTAGLVLVDGMTINSSTRFPVSHKLWLRFAQWTSLVGLPRWRGWCAGRSPELQGISQVMNCRAKVFAAHYREWSQLSESVEQIRIITNLDAMPLLVISRDPARGSNPQEEARHEREQRESLKLSSNSRFLIAANSEHDIPGQRPDVVVEAARSLVRFPAPAGSRGTP